MTQFNKIFIQLVNQGIAHHYDGDDDGEVKTVLAYEIFSGCFWVNLRFLPGFQQWEWRWWWWYYDKNWDDPWFAAAVLPDVAGWFEAHFGEKPVPNVEPSVHKKVPWK